jgi:hypothetical protein
MRLRFWKPKNHEPAFDTSEVLPGPLAEMFNDLVARLNADGLAAAAELYASQVDEIAKTEFQQGVDQAVAHSLIRREVERIEGTRRRANLIAMLTAPALAVTVPGHVDRKKKNGRRRHVAAVVNDNTTNPKR